MSFIYSPAVRRPFGALLAAGCLIALLPSCINKPGEEANVETSDSPIVESNQPAAGLAVPSEVRKNLGVTFAKVEKRQVQDRLRVPGVFELLPGARHEYRALLAGHIQLAAKQFQEVKAGDLLFSIDSPDWRRVQHEAVEAEGEIKIAEAAVRVAEARAKEARTSAAIANQRMENLASVNVRKADLEAEAAALNGSLLRLDAEIAAARAGLDEAEEHYRSRLNTLSSITSIPVETLLAPNGNGDASWRTIKALEIRAKEQGVVELITVNDGAWLESNALAITVLDPAALRFVGKAPQSDLYHLRDGMECQIVPPEVSNGDVEASMQGIMQIGLTAHDEDRTIPLFVNPTILAPWARSGVTAYLEIPKENAPVELAIPAASLVQDGLDTYFFRRDPKDADRVLPVKADLGPSDGRWVTVRSGVKEGDEVVLDGAYALKLAGGSSKAPEGYHYHADGTLHKNH